MVDLNNFRSRLVSTAQSEHQRLKSFRRGDAALTERITTYCGELDVQMNEPAAGFLTQRATDPLICVLKVLK